MDRNYLTLALFTTLLVLIHLLYQHGPCRRWSFKAITYPWAVNPQTTELSYSSTKSLSHIHEERRKRNRTQIEFYVSAKYVPGHEMMHSELCPQLGGKVLVVIVVFSAPENIVARQAIRISWGYIAKEDIKLAFILGQSKPSLRETIYKEDEKHGDIIIGNFKDSYEYLTLKSVSMLEWVSNYCPRARFLLKTDDDVFTNVDLLRQFAKQRVNETLSIWGRLYGKSSPVRSKKDKFYISLQAYPGRKFPNFVAGPAYLLSRDSIPLLLHEALSQRFLYLEDVFITGMLSARVGIRRLHSRRFDMYGHSLPPVCKLRQLISYHEIRPSEQVQLWWRLHNPDNKCDNRSWSDYDE